MSALLFRHPLPFPLGFICKGGQGFESAVGSLFEGLSGRLAGTFRGLVFKRLRMNDLVIIITDRPSSGFTPALT